MPLGSRKSPLSPCRYRWWQLFQTWQRHQLWRQQDLAAGLQLEAQCRRLSHAHQGARRSLEEAKLKADRAREELESVERHGASLAFAARAGIHFFGKLMRRSNGKALEE